MRWFLTLLVLVLVVLLSGCMHGPVSNQAFVSKLVIEVWASTNCANPGETVTLRASVTNNGEQIEFVELKNRPVLDLCISAYGGYNKCWSDNKPLTPDLTRLELKPGQSRSIEMKWIAEPAGEFGAGAIYVFSPNARGSTSANVVVGVEGNCPGQGMR